MNTPRYEASRNSIGAELAGALGILAACAGCTAASGPDPPTVPASLAIQGTTQAADGSRVSDVAVCLRPDPMTTDRAICTTSDRGGAWKLAGVPTNTMVGVTFVRDGFFPMLRSIAMETSDLTIAAGDGALIASADATRMVSAPVDENKGHIAFSTGLPGTRPTTDATVSLGRFDGSREGPLYFDDSGRPVPGATAGTSGVFANLEPGYYVVTFYGASVACSNGSGLYGYPITVYTQLGQARLLVPVVAGFLTAPIAASCSADSGS